jgi:hypothetical protein
MSANRSVQAAQRRRAGPTNAEPAIPGRGPQPSINSSKLFAGQQQQQQQQQQRSGTKQQQTDKTDSLSSISKMTIAQAITLITLRLGSVETKIMNLQNSGEGISNTFGMDGQENMVLMDKGVLDSIISRLESLEKRSSSTSASNSGPEMNLMKQQLENVKQSAMKLNSTTSALVKENKDLKTQVENVKVELNETKELLHALQNLTMDNSQKLLGFSGEHYNELEGVEEEAEVTELEETNDDCGTSGIVGTNLKELIESEINGNM